MASCWFEPITLDRLNSYNKTDMVSQLGLVYTAIGDDHLEACFEINEHTRQPFGLLHGGVSCVVSESMGSTAANLCVDQARFYGVGIEINASHLRGASAGTVRARCEPVRIGRRNQVWQTELFDADERQLCVSRLTVAVVERRDAG